MPIDASHFVNVLQFLERNIVDEAVIFRFGEDKHVSTSLLNLCVDNFAEHLISITITDSSFAEFALEPLGTRNPDQYICASWRAMKRRHDRLLKQRAISIREDFRRIRCNVCHVHLGLSVPEIGAKVSDR